MTFLASAAGQPAATLPLFSSQPQPGKASALFRAAIDLSEALAQGRPLDARTLRTAMETAFGGSDAEGAWNWKLAYDAAEAATVLFLRKFGPAMRAHAGSPAAFLAMHGKVAALLPSQTRRSEESQRFQQFSTPISLGFVVASAAAMTAADTAIEPSAGTGLLAIFAELGGARLILNELGDTRAGLLEELFPAIPVSRRDAAHIHDHLDPGLRPTVVLMNPPFSAAAHVETRVADAALRHISSALARLAEGGRLVAVTGANLSPEDAAWCEGFVRLQERGRVVFSAAIDGRVYARHGTTIGTRLTVIDRVPAEDPTAFPPLLGTATDPAVLLDWVTRFVPPRPAVAEARKISLAARPAVPARPIVSPHRVNPVSVSAETVELAYEPCDSSPEEGARISDALYEPYALQSIRIPGAHPHPTRLVQSAAMASVVPPKPSYHPHLPATVLTEGLLSDAQFESVVSAGEAHSGHLAGSWMVDDTFDVVSAEPDHADGTVHFRRGWFLGDGTGAGKGRQVAGIILDNWLKGRRRAVWLSKSDKLIEDAQRDWSALGQERLLITPLARFRQGAPIRLDEGILFVT
jgi:predicted RNA methylase